MRIPVTRCQCLRPWVPPWTTSSNHSDEIPNISTTEPTSATLGGLPATYLEMTTDDTLPCAPNEFYIWDGNYTQGPGQIVRTWVLEVNGSRVVASALRYPEATQEMLAEQQSILDSLQFE